MSSLHPEIPLLPIPHRQGTQIPTPHRQGTQTLTPHRQETQIPIPLLGYVVWVASLPPPLPPLPPHPQAASRPDVAFITNVSATVPSSRWKTPCKAKKSEYNLTPPAWEKRNSLSNSPASPSLTNEGFTFIDWRGFHSHWLTRISFSFFPLRVWRVAKTHYFCTRFWAKSFSKNSLESYIGKLPEWSNGADSKSAVRFIRTGGLNPSLSAVLSNGMRLFASHFVFLPSRTHLRPNVS